MTHLFGIDLDSSDEGAVLPVVKADKAVAFHAEQCSAPNAGSGIVYALDEASTFLEVAINLDR